MKQCWWFVFTDWGWGSMHVWVWESAHAHTMERRRCRESKTNEGFYLDFFLKGKTMGVRQNPKGEDQHKQARRNERRKSLIQSKSTNRSWVMWQDRTTSQSQYPNIKYPYTSQWHILLSLFWCPLYWKLDHDCVKMGPVIPADMSISLIEILSLAWYSSIA